ncbi:Mov34-domain-containing protein [Mycena olivaceomarginata]|nr:Mov34-domain-containing protein [Mycena olivaceomarginata]
MIHLLRSVTLTPSRKLAVFNQMRLCIPFPLSLSITSANTPRNLETCGLWLGREVVRTDTKSRYVVETLLIPKEHATSNTCAMDEEEGVLRFTEARGLITLGWVNNAHPSQSCVMYASLQRRLPESFAVVCASNSEPSFGIFRLTHPPGLETVLTCTAKPTFPYTYTDPDTGHVHMREAALEIVELR